MAQQAHALDNDHIVEATEQGRILRN